MESIRHQRKRLCKVTSHHLERKEAETKDRDKDKLALVLCGLVCDQHTLAGDGGRGRGAKRRRVDIVGSMVELFVAVTVGVVVLAIHTDNDGPVATAVALAERGFQGRRAGRQCVNDTKPVNGRLGPVDVSLSVVIAVLVVMVMVVIVILMFIGL